MHVPSAEVYKYKDGDMDIIDMKKYAGYTRDGNEVEKISGNYTRCKVGLV